MNKASDIQRQVCRKWAQTASHLAPAATMVVRKTMANDSKTPVEKPSPEPPPCKSPLRKLACEPGFESERSYAGRRDVMKGEGGTLFWRVILLPLAFEALRHQWDKKFIWAWAPKAAGRRALKNRGCR